MARTPVLTRKKPLHDIDPRIILRQRKRSPAPGEGAGLLAFVLDRYAQNSPGRSRRELALAARIDAVRPDARAALDQALVKWRALDPVEKRRLFGGFAGTTPIDAEIDDTTFVREARAVWRDRLVELPTGLKVDARTASVMRRGSFELPDDGLPGNGVIITLPAAEPVQQHTLGGGGPLYRLEFAGIYCQKETSWDMGSSHDEVYCSFSMMGFEAQNWSARSAVYDKMDSGDDWRAEPDGLTLFGPASAPTDGPLSLATLMSEQDYGNPDKVAQLWHDAASVAACIAKYAYGVSFDEATIGAAARLFDWLFDFGDDDLGHAQMMLPAETLAYYAGQPLLHYKIQLNYHFWLFHTDGDAKYYSFYRVTGG
jgi:hypothetical protein